MKLTKFIEELEHIKCINGSDSELRFIVSHENGIEIVDFAGFGLKPNEPIDVVFNAEI